MKLIEDSVVMIDSNVVAEFVCGSNQKKKQQKLNKLH